MRPCVLALVVVVGVAAVLAERPRNQKADQRQGTWSATSTLRPFETTTSPPETTEIISPSPLPSSSGRPTDCADHLMSGATTSGVYEIYPFTCTCSEPVRVWCDMETDGGGWTVFLNRQKQPQQLNFNRTWDEYKEGFGSVTGEHYLGNELLHMMTNSRSYNLRVDADLVSGVQEYTTFTSFKVNSERNRYSVYMSYANTGSTYLRNCLRYAHGRSFTTFDRDYDSYNGNCAAVKGGGWWYYRCTYLDPTTTYNQNLTMSCYGSSRPVSQLQFKMRPAICDSTVKVINLVDTDCGCGLP